ncbi:MAG: hypothetical protein J6P13_00350 [Kiritimatiellae bacterium]|nr:hypothetical protein [Kiritimatiellia bacterium]
MASTNQRLLNPDYRDMVDGLDLKVISIDDLIVNKRASGRPKDIADALALEKLKARQNG